MILNGNFFKKVLTIYLSCFNRVVVISFSADLATCVYGVTKVFNECNLECGCDGGTISNCYRVRSQFSRMLIDDRLYYIKAYKELGQNTRFQEAFYNFLLIHPSIPFGVLHSAEHILPFHRKFVNYLHFLYLFIFILFIKIFALSYIELL